MQWVASICISVYICIFEGSCQYIVYMLCSSLYASSAIESLRVRSSVQLMSQKQPPGRGFLPKYLKCQSSSDWLSDHSALYCARAEGTGLLGPLQIGTRCAWHQPLSFCQSPLNREWRSVLAYVWVTGFCVCRV